MKTLRYFGKFCGFTNKEYRIEIYSDGVGEAKELIHPATPITVEYERESMYAPLMLSQGKISVLSDSPLLDLYTGYNQGVEIKLLNLTDNKLEWFGYFSPNTYSGDYNGPSDSVPLEAVDTLASLENIKYSNISEGMEIRSFKEILLYILDKADPGKFINKVLIHKTLRKDAAATNNIWDDLLIQEANFFDELEEPQSCREVLESLLAYLGMTIVQWEDSFYIVDFAFLRIGTKEFLKIERNTGAESTITIPLTVQNLYNDIGVGGANCNISIGNVYNKVTVIANLNRIKNAIPDIMDEDDIINQNVDSNKRYTTVEKIEGVDYTLLTEFRKSEKNWGRFRPVTNNGKDPLAEVTMTNLNSIEWGTYWHRADNYKNEDGDPSSLNWKEYLTFASSYSPSGYNDAFLWLNQNNVLSFKSGYLILSMRFKLSVNKVGHSCKVEPNDVYTKNQFNKNQINDTWFPCRLSIGNYYYNGEKWISYDEYNTKVSRDYYKTVNTSPRMDIKTVWYRYIDSYGYKRYVSQSEYNSLPASSQKETGELTGYYRYFFYNNNSAVYCTEDYYNECLLRDRFFLVHKNKEGDKIFGTEIELTNTVSYKMDLVDSGDGIAIQLPTERLLSGQLVFEIFRSNMNGATPCQNVVGISPRCLAIHISDLKLYYSAVKSGDYKDDNESDVVYSNVIDDNNVVEADDVKLLVNSFAKNITAYSSVITRKENEHDFIGPLYSDLENGAYLAEELLINKLCDYYSEKKFIYENDLKRKFGVLARIHEDSLNKTMLVGSLSIDYSNEICRTTLLEP